MNTKNPEPYEGENTPPEGENTLLNNHPETGNEPQEVFLITNSLESESLKEDELNLPGNGEKIDNKDFWQGGPNKKIGKKKGGFFLILRETLTIFITALIIAFLLKSFIIDTRIIPSLSMYPTVHAGDRLIINKLSYIKDSLPQRGDIVVFKPPLELESKDDLLKRIIGLPGETLEVKEGQVYINGKALEENYLFEAPIYIYGPVEVPQGHYFMMGDNRNQSVDSHLWEQSFIPKEDILGKVLVRYWPLDRMGKLGE